MKSFVNPTAQVASMVIASTPVVKDVKRSRQLGDIEIFRSVLARTAIPHDIETDLLAFPEEGHARALNGGDVNEHVCGSIAWLDKAKALIGIEEFYYSVVHDDFLSIA
jgi:hypothetical protein